MAIDNVISATEASRSFSEIINKVYYQHQTFEIKKGKTTVAKIVPYHYASQLGVKDLNNFFRNSPKISNSGADEFVDEINKIRSNSLPRISTWD